MEYIKHFLSRQFSWDWLYLKGGKQGQTLVGRPDRHKDLNLSLTQAGVPHPPPTAALSHHRLAVAVMCRKHGRRARKKTSDRLCDYCGVSRALRMVYGIQRVKGKTYPGDPLLMRGTPHNTNSVSQSVPSALGLRSPVVHCPRR